jgi:hypothetical protein
VNPVSEITISFGEDDFCFEVADRQPMALRGDFKELLMLLVAKALVGNPCELVEWRAINEAVGDKEANPDVASIKARQALRRINAELRRIGPTPDGAPHIVTVKGRGAHLNASVTWLLSGRLRDKFRSVYTHSTPPGVLDGVAPGRRSRKDAEA